MKARLRRRQSGQAMVEYALILVLIAVACVVMLTVFGQQLINLWQSIIDGMRNPGHIL